MKVIITGSTGMVGKSVLMECLASENVEQVLSISRSSVGIENPKLIEVIHKDFSDFSAIKEELKGYDACFYCMGVSALGMNEEDYTRIIYGMTKALADTLFELNNQLVFNFVSGMSTDSSEQGSAMWARVKGKTENMILAMGFKDAYAFRPGAIFPEKGIKSKTAWYNIIYTLLKPFFPLLIKSKSAIMSSDIGKAMINVVLTPYPDKVLENHTIKEIAKNKYPEA
ncbi:NAD-dependent epimerase/dehydratase family protein [Aureibacter tunicatorum]|uniref:Nucleoside-diphosphate-sugar epimerase n=1 Tax=Aureibacter tunicatorum TaxID=866807 RepID=A0AAE4BTY7_9BACT|nr:NAD-dependent epimerase/dehydratase family protein [Aureibacter tunicatorum]MDR6240430.1 nucleoside-diphosphate-sugar epimerase [Aureibacter tunicatorum]BDD05691.1 epimerase [Aureibacter tunicatorum]